MPVVTNQTWWQEKNVDDQKMHYVVLFTKSTSKSNKGNVTK